MNNICHFVFGLEKQTEEFFFTFYVAVYSAYVINNPDIIYFYYHHEPYGKWWDRLKLIPCINLEKIDIPTNIGCKKIIKTNHTLEWIKMNILYNKGGVYLDINTMCIRPWKKILNKDLVLRKEDLNGICNTIMFTKPNSVFLKELLDNFQQYGWEEASIKLSETIAKKNNALEKNLDIYLMSDEYEIQNIFEYDTKLQQNITILQLWENNTVDYIKKINDWSWAFDNSHTMYGKLLLNLKRFNTENINDNNDICMLTVLIGGPYINQCSYGTLSKEHYCNVNNYDLIIGREEDYDKIKIKRKKFGWLKVYKLIEIIDKYGFIFVSDADVSIMNYNIKLQDIIDNYFDEDTLMIITKDQNNINSGNFIIRGKNKLINKYLNMWKETLVNIYPRYIGIQEQPSLINMILNTDFKNYVKIIDQSIINSYPDVRKNKGSKIYKNNDLLIHYAGFNCRNISIEKNMEDNFYKSISR